MTIKYYIFMFSWKLNIYIEILQLEIEYLPLLYAISTRLRAILKIRIQFNLNAHISYRIYNMYVYIFQLRINCLWVLQVGTHKDIYIHLHVQCRFPVLKSSPYNRLYSRLVQKSEETLKPKNIATSITKFAELIKRYTFVF